MRLRRWIEENPIWAPTVLMLAVGVLSALIAFLALFRDSLDVTFGRTGDSRGSVFTHSGRTAEPTTSVSAAAPSTRLSSGAGPAGTQAQESTEGRGNDIDPMNCFGKPRLVTLTPRSGSKGEWIRVTSSGFLPNEEVRIVTWAGSTFSTTADSKGAINSKARITTAVGISVIVYVSGMQSGCGGDAVFMIE